MMGGTMVFGWIGGLVILVLIVTGVVLLAKEPGGGSGSNPILTVLAVIGGVALAGVAAMVLMQARIG